MTEQSAPLELTREVLSVGEADVAFVRVAGELDLSNADELSSSADPAGAAGLVVDLRQVGFIDSSGLRVLLIAAERCAPSFATIVAPGSPVDKLITFVEVAERLNVAGDDDDAVRRMRVSDASG